MVSFDANILIYSVDKAAGDRHRNAAALVERAIRGRRCVQTLQSLCEFFNASRKVGIDAQTATRFVDRWQAAAIVEPAAAIDLDEAIRVVREHRLPFWDAMLWATARRAGARVLISEDFQDRRTLEGVRFINPFEASNAPVIDAELAG